MIYKAPFKIERLSNEPKYIAYLTDAPSVRQSGATPEEAAGKLRERLDRRLMRGRYIYIQPTAENDMLCISGKIGYIVAGKVEYFEVMIVSNAGPYVIRRDAITFIELEDNPTA